MNLVMTFGGKIHKSGCHSAKRVYKGIAPDIFEADAVELIRVRKLDACGSCFPELRHE